MSILSALRGRFLRSVRTELGILIYSAVIGVIAWFLISMTIYPTTPKAIHNIPLTIDLTNSQAEKDGLQVINNDWKDVTVSVTIQGNRSQIGSLTADDLVAKVALENVNSAGKYELNINVSSKSGVEFTVTSQTPRSVNVTFDKISTKEVPVRASLPNVTAVEGMALDSDNIVCSPETIEVTGPTASLALLDHITVAVPDNRVLSSTYTFTNVTQYLMYDASNKEIDSSAFEMVEGASFTVTVPVCVQIDLGLDLSVTQVPTNFDLDFLKQHLDFSVDKITIRSQNKITSENWTIGPVRLSDINEGFQNDFAIELKEGDTEITGQDSVRVSLDMEGLATKKISVKCSDISIQNPPSNYDFEMRSSKMTVTVIGPEEDIAKLTAADLLMTIDLSDYIVTDDSFNQSVSISIPDYGKVWAVNTNNIWLNAKEKPATTTAP